MVGRGSARRSLQRWGLVLAALCGPSAVLAGENSVTVRFEGQQAFAELKGVANAVVPACRGVEWQRFDAELARFVPVPAEGCGAMSAALPLPAAGLTVAATVRLREGDNVRAVAIFGVGCRPDQPLQRGKCAKLEAVESVPVIVPPRAAAGG